MKQIVRVFALLLCAGLLVSCTQPKDDKQQGDSSQLPAMAYTSIEKFAYTSGSFSGGYREYSLVKEQDQVRFLAVGYNGVESQLECKVPLSVMDELKAILIEYDMAGWNGFDEHDQNILDGHVFLLEVTFADGTDLIAQGYMRYPAGFDEASRALDGYLDELVREYAATDFEQMGALIRFSYSWAHDHGSEEYQIVQSPQGYQLEKYVFDTLQPGYPVLLTDEEIEELNLVIDQNRMWSWDKFHRQAEDMVDGFGYRLEIEYENRTIRSSGYGFLPPGFEVGAEALNEYFQTVEQHAMGEQPEIRVVG